MSVARAQGSAGVQVIVLVGSRPQPIAEEQARPLIEQQLLAERRRKAVEDDLKALRAAATVEYLGPFAGGNRTGAAASDVPVAPSEPSEAAPTGSSATR